MALSRSSFDASSIMTPNDKIVNEIDKDQMGKKTTTSDDEKRASRLMWLFMFNVCAVSMGHVILTVYTNGVIRTLERRFGLSSAKSGLLNSCNDVIHICLVIFIGYFGQRYNKPRIICVTIMFSAIAGVMMASPHVLLSDYDDTYVHRKNFNTSQNGRMQYKAVSNFTQEQHVMTEDFTAIPSNVYSVEHVFSTSSPNPEKSSPVNKEKPERANNIQYCTKTENDSDDLENGNCQDIDQDRIHPAFYIFVVAQLISGTGSSGAFTLSMAYVDENAPKHLASIYIGAFMSLFSFAPVTGFMLATLCLKFPENLLSGSSVDSTDPSFIGCWWLGYLIGGIYIAVFAIPLWWYPKKISNKNVDPLKVEKATLITDEKEEGLLEQLKGIPKAFAGLLSNKLFLVNVCQIVCSAYTIYGIFVNLVRYIEIHFNRTAAEGSVIAGVVSAVTGAVGNISGGALVSRFKMRAIDGIRLVLFSSFVFATGNFILMNLACPQVEMDMNYDPKLELNTVLNDCNKPCLCTTNRVDYRPICASNNVSYFSPCVAGCSESVNGTFIDCKCLNTPGLMNVTTNEYKEGTARTGYCIPSCDLLIPFAFTLFVMSFCSSLSRVPSTMISFRIVKDEERSFALGINSFAINLFGFVPSPLIFGYLIDKTCILWQVTCKTIGACLMFDVARFRYSIFGSGLVIEVINFGLNFTLFLFLRKMALGSTLLSRKKDEICRTEVKLKEEEENKSNEDGLKTIEMDKLKTNDITQLTNL